jgi:hypothetical protein
MPSSRRDETTIAQRFKRWDCGRMAPSPEGTIEQIVFQPSLRDSLTRNPHPAFQLKRWAIFVLSLRDGLSETSSQAVAGWKACDTAVLDACATVEFTWVIRELARSTRLRLCDVVATFRRNPAILWGEEVPSNRMSRQSLCAPRNR